DDELADAGLDLGDRQLLATEVLLEQLLVRLGDGLDELRAVLLGTLLEVGRDLLDLVLLAHLGVAAPRERLHLNQVDDALEVVLSADRELDDERLRLE